MTIVLSAVMLVNTGITAFASDYGSTYVSDENETLLVVEDGLFVNGHFYTRVEFEYLLNSAIEISTDNTSEGTGLHVCSAAALVAGT